VNPQLGDGKCSFLNYRDIVMKDEVSIRHASDFAVALEIRKVAVRLSASKEPKRIPKSSKSESRLSSANESEHNPE
jgi:hypothetical protein